MKETFHVDTSGRIYTKKTLGIAVVGSKTKENYGCAVRGNLIKLVMKKLFKSNIYKESAKLYAICIYALIKDVTEKIDKLVICNDEDFIFVKKYLLHLLNDSRIVIINISEFRKSLGRNIGSMADNYAKSYRRRALKPFLWNKGKKIQVKVITYSLIKEYWEKLENIH
jgi:hypothetical protein